MKSTVWIRVKNLVKWKAIKDKSAWINAHLEKEAAVEQEAVWLEDEQRWSDSD